MAATEEFRVFSAFTTIGSMPRFWDYQKAVFHLELLHHLTLDHILLTLY